MGEKMFQRSALAVLGLAVVITGMNLPGNVIEAEAVTKEDVDASWPWSLDVYDENFRYSIGQDYTAWVCEYIGSSKVVTVPDEIDGFQIDYAADTFYSRDYSYVTSVTYEAGIKTIEASSIEDAPNVTDITILNDEVEIAQITRWDVPYDWLVPEGSRAILLGNEGSNIQKYAGSHNLTFVSLADKPVMDFAKRMYNTALNRDAEPAGLNDWTTRLLNHTADGAEIAWGFIASAEFQNRNLSDSDYVNTLYRTFFDREGDAEGKANWMDALAGGENREAVLAGFVNSEEFQKLCDAYGIIRGELSAVSTAGTAVQQPAVNTGVRAYVERIYTRALNRTGEKAGIDDWTNRIETGMMTPEQVAESFFYSEEFEDRQLDSEAYVETLYQTFFDRNPDADGKEGWLDALDRGMSREEVLHGFSRSEEFAKLVSSFGL